MTIVGEINRTPNKQYADELNMHISICHDKDAAYLVVLINIVCARSSRKKERKKREQRREKQEKSFLSSNYI